MRIGIHDPYLDDLGGGEKYMMTIAMLLAKSHNIFVFWDKSDDLDKLKERFSLDITGIKLVGNIFSSKVGLFRRFLETRKYDVIISLTDGSIPFVASKKLFLHIQQPLPGLNTSSVKNKLKISRISKVFYNSKFTKSFNDKTFGDAKSLVIYPPVQVFTKDVNKENIIAHVGRFRVMNVNNPDFKKQIVMVETFKRMIDEGLNDWKFIIATSVNNENDPAFLSMLKSANGYPVEFLINKNNKDLWDLYNKSKIYWHASGYGEDLEMHPEYAEHFGISTVEAMGTGVVPVVINAGGQREIVTDQKNGFLWNDLDELIDRTNLLINDTKMFDKMSALAKKRANDFGIDKFQNAIDQMLK